MGQVQAGGSDQALRERSEEHTSELQSPCNLVCRLLLEKKQLVEVQLDQAVGISGGTPPRIRRDRWMAPVAERGLRRGSLHGLAPLEAAPVQSHSPPGLP